MKRGVIGSDPGEARKSQIMQDFTSHAEEFRLYPKRSREPQKNLKMEGVCVKEIIAATGAQIGGGRINCPPIPFPL